MAHRHLRRRRLPTGSAGAVKPPAQPVPLPPIRVPRYHRPPALRSQGLGLVSSIPGGVPSHPSQACTQQPVVPSSAHSPSLTLDSPLLPSPDICTPLKWECLRPEAGHVQWPHLLSGWQSHGASSPRCLEPVTGSFHSPPLQAQGQGVACDCWPGAQWDACSHCIPHVRHPRLQLPRRAWKREQQPLCAGSWG